MPLPPLPLTLDDDVLSYLGELTDLINFASTSKEAYVRTRAFMSRTFRLRRLLSQFLDPDELEAFQQLQRRSGLLISGEALLFFLLRSEQKSDRLDLFLHLQYKDLFREWITSTRYAAEDDAPNVTEQVESLGDFQRSSEKAADWSALLNTRGFGTEITVVLKGSSKKIVVHFSEGPPIQMILDLPATCLMNIATHSRIYSLYPKATFLRRISLLRPHWRNVISLVKLEPYHYLGFRFMDSCWDSFLPLFPFGRRRVGDDYTYVIDLDFENENEDEDIDYRLLTNSWMVYYLPKGVMDIHGITLRSARLQDVYVVSDELVRKDVDDLVGRLSQSSDIPSSDFFDKELCREILREIFPQTAQLRLSYE